VFVTGLFYVFHRAFVQDAEFSSLFLRRTPVLRAGFLVHGHLTLGFFCVFDRAVARIPYGVALVSRIDKIIGLFCKTALQKRRCSFVFLIGLSRVFHRALLCRTVVSFLMTLFLRSGFLICGYFTLALALALARARERARSLARSCTRTRCLSCSLPRSLPRTLRRSLARALCVPCPSLLSTLSSLTMSI